MLAGVHRGRSTGPKTTAVEPHGSTGSSPPFSTPRPSRESLPACRRAPLPGGRPPPIPPRRSPTRPTLGLGHRLVVGRLFHPRASGDRVGHSGWRIGSRGGRGLVPTVAADSEPETGTASPRPGAGFRSIQHTARCGRGRPGSAAGSAISGLQPENAYAQIWYAILLAQLHRHGESLRRIHQAEALDPVSPVLRLSVGRCYYFAPSLRGGAGVFPGHVASGAGESANYDVVCPGAGMYRATRRGARGVGKVTASGLQRSNLDAFRAVLLAGAGRREDSLSLCRTIQQELQERQAPYSHAFVATALFQLGARDEAFEILEQGVHSPLGIYAVRG